MQVQLVGMNCGKCDRSISFATEALYCSKCEKAYHKGCAESNRTCPTCATNECMKDNTQLTAIEKETEAKTANTKEQHKEKIGSIIIAIVLLALGIVILIYPDALQSYDVHGRRSLLKSIVKFCWNIPGGIIGILISLTILWSYLKKPDSKQ
jgi:hypothetical protein